MRRTACANDTWFKALQESSRFLEEELDLRSALRDNLSYGFSATVTVGSTGNLLGAVVPLWTVVSRDNTSGIRLEEPLLGFPSSGASVLACSRSDTAGMEAALGMGLTGHQVGLLLLSNSR